MRRGPTESNKRLCLKTLQEEIKLEEVNELVCLEKMITNKCQQEREIEVKRK